MQRFKLLIKAGIEERGFVLTQIFDKHSDIPWWMEERWIISRSFDKLELNVLFMTEHSWDRGSKIVSDVYICKELPTNLFYNVEHIASLSLAKGKFDLKLHAFFRLFDDFLNRSE